MRATEDAPADKKGTCWTCEFGLKLRSRKLYDHLYKETYWTAARVQCKLYPETLDKEPHDYCHQHPYIRTFGKPD